MTITKENRAESRALVLMRAAESLANGDLQARVPSSPDEELGPLCTTFNRMADAIAQRDRERLEFAASAAHDMKAPLTVIKAAAELLQDGDFAPHHRHWLNRMLENAADLELMIAEFMDEVQVRSGRLQLQCSEIDLLELARDVVSDSIAVTKTHQLRIEGDQVCTVWGDRSRLKRMLQNLISNAIKYSAPGREVNTSVWRRGAEVWLTVEDQGEGIKPSDTERIFRPFLRLDATNSMAGGSGLGLLSVQKIVEAHSGEISVQGEPGRGTTVEIRFKARLREME